MKEEDRYIDMDMADTIIDRPLGFSIGNRHYDIYPVTLGKSMLIQRLTANLELDSDNIKINPYMEMLRVCEDKKSDVCRILSIHTFNRKEDVLDNTKIGYRARVFEHKLSNEEIAKLFLVTLSDNVERFIKYLGIDSERPERERITSFKKSKSYSVSFGGKSIYGTLIDYACQRYGWTMDYVVWGISYANLKMLISDAVTTIELSKEDAKALRISQGGTISADDPNNIDKIRCMFGD